MDEGVCELCGKISQLDTLEVHHIVPEEITSQPGVRPSATADLCQHCHQEVHDWYAKKVSTTTYDPYFKHFKAKPPADAVKDYEAAYRLYATYKQKLRGRA